MTEAWLWLLAGVTITMPALAQRNTSSAIDDSLVDEIIVTGSRIPRAGFDTLAPANVLDADFIEERGFTDIATALNEIPAFGFPDSSTFYSSGDYSVGQNFINFFGLGSQRTLTLVNGRRFVSSNSPSFVGPSAGLQVDLNMIPASLVERIETIAVGGAPVYGADAIAGTVNIIMKRDFEGFDINTSYGISEVGELADTKFAVAWGANSSDGRGNVALSIEYTDRDGMLASDMDHHKSFWTFSPPADPSSTYDFVLTPDSRANIVSLGGVATPIPFLIPNLGVGQYDNGQYFQFAPDGSLVPFDVGAPTGGIQFSIGGDGLHLPEVQGMFTPLERTLLNGFANYELTEGVEVFGEIWAGRTEATLLARQPAFQSGFFGNEAQSLFFPIDHPMLTQAAQTTLQNLTFFGAPIPGFWIQRASTDLRPNNNANTQDGSMLRVVAGLQGAFEAAKREFQWDISYNTGESTSYNKTLDIDNKRFFYALDVIPDPITGELGCRVTVDPSSRPADPSAPLGTNLGTDVYDDCAPLDIFGHGRASPESIDYITVNVLDKSVLEQQVVSANIGTDFLRLPAGSLSVSAGFEHREESAEFQPDGFAAGGLGKSNFLPVQAVFGAYETDEVYAEFLAPLVAADMDIPFLSSASIEGAWRTVDHSFAGRDDIWTFGGRLAPIPDIEFRGNLTRSVRAPAIAELLLPPTAQLHTAEDPCDFRFVDEGPSPATRRANCVSGGGHLPPIPDPDNFVSTVEDPGVFGASGGNPDLSNEVADAWTLGVILRPRFIEGLRLAIDYVDIEIKDAILPVDLWVSMELCYDDPGFPNNRFCNKFVRQADGQLPPGDAFVIGPENLGQVTFSGFTVEALYSTDLGAGKFDASTSIMNLRDSIIREQDVVFDGTGTVARPEWEANVSLRYSRDKWSVMLEPRFIGGGRWRAVQSPNQYDVPEADDVWLINGSLDYQFNEILGMRLHIDNITNELQSPEGTAAGREFPYFNIGRYYRLGLQFQL